MANQSCSSVKIVITEDNEAGPFNTLINEILKECIFHSRKYPWKSAAIDISFEDRHEVYTIDNCLNVSLKTVEENRDSDRARKMQQVVDGGSEISNQGLDVELQPLQLNKEQESGSAKAELSTFKKNWKRNPGKLYKDKDERRYRCNFCTQLFISPSHLELHIRKHTGERPYECQQCKNRFANSQILSRHISSHIRKRAFQCQNCHFSFPKSSSLKSHVERVHQHSKVKT